MSIPEKVQSWVREVERLCQPDRVYFCTGSAEERVRLTEECLESGELLTLNQEKLPRSYLHRSHPSDVARTEEVTFICTSEKDDAGPLNNWMAPDEARTKLTKLFRGAMRGRTLYVVPFIMGPVGSRFSKVGVQVTDSRYVVLNMGLLTRMGERAWEFIDGSFTRCLHSLGDLAPERRFITHFPEDNEVWSIGSGYGGNAIMSKKCMALRLASYLGYKEGWMAEHMLILGIQPPGGETFYVTGAFPSASGKTNLAMLIPPEEYKGWKVWTVGDDIAWLRVGDDGRLWAVNPEAGFFGVVPGTSSKTNPAAMATISHDTIYTNVAMRPDKTVWWEGHDDPPAAGMLDWQGRPWSPGSSEKAAHPNARFSVSAAQCPSISPEWENPQGVPISAILFGARRQRIVPLVCESMSWQHGTFLGATLSTETTAAATGALGRLRHDPMAMRPFCGYNMADYFGHWVAMGRKLRNPPKIFRVDWFRSSAEGKFLWPGYGENLRVLEWILERSRGGGEAQQTALGFVPTKKAIRRAGLNVTDAAFDELLKVDPTEWEEALKRQREFFTELGDRLPSEMWDEHKALAKRISSMKR